MVISCYKAVVLASLCLPGVSSRFLGPMDPAPVDISGKDSIVRAAWQNITSKLEDHFSGKARFPPYSVLVNSTFSLGLFSTHDTEAAGCLQYHHTGPDVRNSTNGVNTVNGDSIYRVASLSKLFTVFAGLIKLKPQDWNSPLAEIFPEIAKLPNNDPIRHVDWNAITPLNLASQISGVPRDGRPFDQDYVKLLMSNPAGAIDPATYGLPTLSSEEYSVEGPCKDYNCSAVDYIKGLNGPTFLPWQTPGYANTGFILLGRVISRLTNMAIEQFYRNAILDPLNMGRTTSISPTEKGYPGYVVVEPVASFAFEGGISSTSGGVFSTTNDLAKLGTAILNSTLLPADQTRKWMKPSTFTAHQEFAQGMGWEIYRYTHRNTGHITDMYTKLGDSGSYASYLVLIPDYDVGFSVIHASGLAVEPVRSSATRLLADIVSEAILPALQAQAAREAKRNFAGTYTDGKNSSLTLDYNEAAGDKAGLTLISFTNEGVNMMDILSGGASWVLQPAIAALGQERQLSFQATPVVNSTEAADKATGLFSKQFAVNSDWITNNVVTYGGQGAGTFIFNVSNHGEATAVSPAFLRKTFQRRK
ncbi:beta-lactamase/transpeptidase-like protein [Apiospora arundinis]|uniref:Beta-lactamase/transpeptidase-like protein n=1 Tax=Apiospora arundinis TaxID=335852 RepID=A0ABR2J6C9_9PEZI